MTSPLYQPLPPLTDAEYEALKADIAEHGVQYPVITDEHGNVIDGHHRLRICQELGNSPPVEVRAGLTEDAKHDLAISLNLQRRHLSQIQRRDLIRAELERNPDRSNRAIARLCGVDHKTVAVVRYGGRMDPELRITSALVALDDPEHALDGALALNDEVVALDQIASERVWITEDDVLDSHRQGLDAEQLECYVRRVNQTLTCVLKLRLRILLGYPGLLGMSPRRWLNGRFRWIETNQRDLTAEERKGWQAFKSIVLEKTLAKGEPSYP